MRRLAARLPDAIFKQQTNQGLELASTVVELFEVDGFTLGGCGDAAVFQGAECFRARAYNFGRDAHYGAAIRNRMNNDGAGADLDVIAEANIAEHGGSSADHHALAKSGMPLAAHVAGSAKRDALIEKNVVAYLGCFADHNAEAMIDE